MHGVLNPPNHPSLPPMGSYKTNFVRYKSEVVDIYYFLFTLECSFRELLYEFGYCKVVRNIIRVVLEGIITLFSCAFKTGSLDRKTVHDSQCEKGAIPRSWIARNFLCDRKLRKYLIQRHCVTSFQRLFLE